MDITVDEGFSVGFINKEDSFTARSKLTGCSVCTEDHETEKCSIFDNLLHIEDSKVLPRALLTLPPDLKVETLSDGSKSVIATKNYRRGTRFGPYQAEKFYSLNPFDNFPIKIFGDSENILPDYYLDSRNEEKCNWMCYISAASNFEEQNLICYQIKLEIFYSVIRDINPGEHLKVWYSTYYAAKIGSEIHVPKQNNKFDPYDYEKNQEMAETLPAKKLGAEERRNWCCKICGYNEANVVKFAKHLQKHYFKMIKNAFVCNVCNGGFGTEKALRLHRKYAHIIFTDHKPCDIENFIEKPLEVPKSVSVDPRLPTPPPIDSLISNSLTESDQLLMLDQFGIPNSGIYNDYSDAETLRAILCDDNTKASKIAQEKSIADFSLELVESNEIIPKLQPPYNCDICNKVFNNLQYLYRHLKKHAGEYTCVQCLAVFTRRENYLRHPCFTADSLKKYNCSYCTKSFYQKKYLRRHINKHLNNYPCANCGKQYKSKYDRENHNCSSISITQKTLYPCNQCNRKFLLEVYLQRHVKRTHEERVRMSTGQTFICEICAKTYHTPQALNTHKRQHAEPKYECRVCDKKFYRYDLYKNHLLGHGSAREVCDICNKKFTTKSSLKEHKVLHTSIRFSCEYCGKKYSRKKGLNEHQRKVHLENPIVCPDCGKKIKNNFCFMEHKRKEHTAYSHECKICNKTFTLNYLLTRHEKIYHTGKTYCCPYCSKTFKVVYSLRSHLKKYHLELKDQWDKPKNLSKKDNSITITSVDPKGNTEILLRLPETNKKGRNVLILENGAIETTAKDSQNINKKAPEKTISDLSNTESITITKTDKLDKNKEIIQIENLSVTNRSLSPTENEQQITLGKNAYILEDGTIVQPQDQGDVMIYILN